MLEIRVDAQKYNMAFVVRPVSFNAFPVSTQFYTAAGAGEPEKTFTIPRNPFPPIWRKAEDPLPKPEETEDLLV